MEKERKAKMIRTCGLIFAFFFLLSPLTSFAFSLEEDFDSVGTGPLESSGLDDFFTDNPSNDETRYDITNAGSFSSPNSIQSSGGTGVTSLDVQEAVNSTVGYISQYAYLDMGASSDLLALCAWNDCVRIYNGGVESDGISPSFEWQDTPFDSEWGFMEIWWRVEGGVYQTKLGFNYVYTGWNDTPYNVGESGNIPRIGYNQNISGGDIARIDNVVVIVDDTVPDESEPPPPCSSGGSCLFTINPDRGAVVASTTATSATFTIGVTGYVSPDEFEEGMTVQQSYYRQSSLWGGSVADSQIGLAPNSLVIEWPITSAGDFSFSTTTTVEDISGLVQSFSGKYYHKATLAYPQGFFKKVIGWFGFYTTGEELVEINTFFTVAEPNFIDTVYEDPTNFVTGGNGNPSPILDCDIDLDFNLVSCVYSLIVPPQERMAEVWNSFLENALATVPLGYVTRFATIVLSPSSVQPPPLEYTFGSSSPAVLQGKGVSFQIFDEFDVLNSIEADDGSGKTIWDIVMPFFNTVIALGVLGVILRDLLAIGVPDFTSDKRKDQKMSTKDIDNMKVNDYSDISEEEWQNLKRNRLL